MSRNAEWTEWIRFFAYGVAEQARDAVLRIRKLLELGQEFRKLSMAATRSTQALRLNDQLFSSPYITVNYAATTLGVAFKSAGKIVEKLVEIGILREVTGQQRNRVFRADRIFKLLDEPLDPEAP